METSSRTLWCIVGFLLGVAVCFGVGVVYIGQQAGQTTPRVLTLELFNRIQPGQTLAEVDAMIPTTMPNPMRETVRERSVGDDREPEIIEKIWTESSRGGVFFKTEIRLRFMEGKVSEKTQTGL